MKIKIHRGSHQIGGSITEIKTESARIIIDIGSELPSADTKKVANFEIEGVTAGVPDCDGVFITHYHGDHVGEFEKVLPEVPIYMGEVAKKIYLTLQRKIKRGKPDIVEMFKTFEAGKPIIIKDIKITPYMIDHSAFDAYMLLIEAEVKRILHTGDFRMHGARGRKMPAVFEKYAKNIDVLIIEGTMLSRSGEKVMTEHELGRKAKELIQDNKSVFVFCSSTNIDSIAQFYSATIQSKKPFIVIDDYQQEILKIVTNNSRSSLYDFSKQKIYAYSTRNKKLHEYMKDRGFCMLIRAGKISEKVVKEFPNSLLIYSMWEGYLNKNHTAFNESISNIVGTAKEVGSKYQYLHTSGHATVDDIKKVCEITNAKMIIPIHTEAPEVFTKMSIAGEIVLLKDGEGVTV